MDTPPGYFGGVRLRSGVKMKYTGDKMFYRKTARIAVPIIIQNGFTFLVNFVDNIMVGSLGQKRCPALPLSIWCSAIL